MIPFSILLYTCAWLRLSLSLSIRRRDTRSRLCVTRHTIEGEMMCSLAAHIVVSSSSSHIRCWHFWYLRARPRDHYSPFAGMHTQFSSEGFLAMPCTARSDRTSFIIIIRTQDTYTHKILNIISRNNFWFFNVEFFSHPVTYARASVRCALLRAYFHSSSLMRFFLFWFWFLIFPFELLHLVVELLVHGSLYSRNFRTQFARAAAWANEDWYHAVARNVRNVRDDGLFGT